MVSRQKKHYKYINNENYFVNFLYKKKVFIFARRNNFQFLYIFARQIRKIHY